MPLIYATGIPPQRKIVASNNTNKISRNQLILCAYQIKPQLEIIVY